MAHYTLKIYRRQRPQQLPGELVGEFTIAANAEDGAIASVMPNYATHLANSNYAVIGDPHGRIIWERYA